MRCLFAVLSVLSLLGCAEPVADGELGICSQLNCDDGDDCTKDICDETDPRVCLFPAAEEGTPCNGGGVCDGAENCIECNEDQDCEDDLNECTRPSCDGIACGQRPISDGALCSGGACQGGQCELSSLVLPCTEQGILNAIAAGGGPFGFDCDGPTRLTTKAEIVIDNDVVFSGDGNLTVEGGDHHRVFSVSKGTTAWLDELTVTRGFAAESCGGLLNDGTLLLTDVLVLGNAATSGGGGICNSGTLTMTGSRVAINSANACAGIFNNGTLTVTKSTVSGNIATWGGGGICSSVALTMTGSTLVGNVADRAGGLENSGNLTMSNSTVSGNVSEGGGGGLFNSGAATVTNSTLSGNVAGDDGGGIRNVGTLIIENSLVDGRCSGGVDAISSLGYNIESTGDTCGFDQETDQVEVRVDDLRLESLAYNGGSTRTHALLLGSVAIDRIPEEICELTDDQRGVVRPQGAMCDIGAFEFDGQK